MPNICPRYAGGMSKIYPRYAQDMPKICPRYTLDMPKISPKYARDIPKIYKYIFLKYARDMPQICQRYAQDFKYNIAKFCKISKTWINDSPTWIQGMLKRIGFYFIVAKLGRPQIVLCQIVLPPIYVYDAPRLMLHSNLISPERTSSHWHCQTKSEANQT